MELFVGLDVSVRTTSVCVMDAGGKLIRESKVESEPEAIGELLHAIGRPYKRVGLEAGPLSQWLYSGLASAGFPVICVETRHMKAALSAQINKMVCPGGRREPQAQRRQPRNRRRRSSCGTAGWTCRCGKPRFALSMETERS
jgi:transposase